MITHILDDEDKDRIPTPNQLRKVRDVLAEVVKRNLGADSACAAGDRCLWCRAELGLLVMNRMLGEDNE